MPRKKIPKNEQVDAILDKLKERIDLATSKMDNKPKPGDIIQITTKPHPFMARIGIVHHADGETLFCYQPGKNGFPYQFKVASDVVTVVGQARLKYGKPNLPEESVYSDNGLDKI